MNNSINQFDLVDIYRILHMKIDKGRLFSSIHKTFTKEDYILVHKISMNWGYKSYTVKLSKKSIAKRYLEISKHSQNGIPLNNPWVKELRKRKIEWNGFARLNLCLIGSV